MKSERGKYEKSTIDFRTCLIQRLSGFCRRSARTCPFSPAAGHTSSAAASQTDTSFYSPPPSLRQFCPRRTGSRHRQRRHQQYSLAEFGSGNNSYYRSYGSGHDHNRNHYRSGTGSQFCLSYPIHCPQPMGLGLHVRELKNFFNQK